MQTIEMNEQVKKQFGITTKILAGICHKCEICPLLIKSRILFLGELCTGIEHGVQPGLHIQKSTGGNYFLKRFRIKKPAMRINVNSLRVFS